MRVPVIHKFGIVSVSRAEQLLREGREDRRGSKKKHARWEGLLAAVHHGSVRYNIMVCTTPVCLHAGPRSPVHLSKYPKASLQR